MIEEMKDRLKAERIASADSKNIAVYGELKKLIKRDFGDVVFIAMIQEADRLAEVKLNG